MLAMLTTLVSLGTTLGFLFWFQTALRSQAFPPVFAGTGPRAEPPPLLQITQLVQTPSRHPAEIARWTRVALAPLDRGELWLDYQVDQARAMLGNWWEIHEPSAWVSTLANLLSAPGPLRAWDGLRAIRVLMAGARLGWVSEAVAWEVTTAIVAELGQHHASFDSLWHDYHAAYRHWRRLPPDGWDVELIQRHATLDVLASISWLQVPFESPPFDVDAYAVDRASAVVLLRASVATPSPITG